MTFSDRVILALLMGIVFFVMQQTNAHVGDLQNRITVLEESQR